MPPSTDAPRLILRIDFGDGRRLGPGKVRLLELIGEHGSISAASRLMRMSYRRAWALTEDLNTTFGEKLVAARTGGAGGGSAELTGVGREIVRRYRALEAISADKAKGELAALTRALALPPGKDGNDARDGLR